MVQYGRKVVGIVEINIDSLDFSTIILRDRNNKEEKLDVLEDLKVNEFDLQNELYTQPSKYMYYTSLLETVRAYYESSELQLEQTWARLYEPARTALIQGGTQRPTKDQIESWIYQQDEYIGKKNAANHYSSLVKKLQYIVKSFEQRKDMLIQLATDSRKQREYEQAINR